MRWALTSRKVLSKLKSRFKCIVCTAHGFSFCQVNLQNVFKDYAPGFAAIWQKTYAVKIIPKISYVRYVLCCSQWNLITTTSIFSLNIGMSL